MLEIEDAKSDLTNTVKSIVQRSRESVKGPPPSEDLKERPAKEAVPESKGGKEQKQRTESKTGQEGKEEGKDNPTDEESSGEERSSFYEEIFYDALSENTFTPAKNPPEKVGQI